MAEQAIAIRETALPAELSVESVLAQVEKIQMLMKTAMKENEHYGVIPGKLCLMFRLDPEYDTTEKYDGDHLTVVSRCTLYHITSQMRMGSGIGMCSTRESKYAYRKAQRVCPVCGAEAIYKDKGRNGQPGVGYYCWKQKDGCGAQFKTADMIKQVESQETGRVANPDLPDQYNTVLKMAAKRSLVDAVLKVTAASDIFTQDLDDITDKRAKAKHDEAEHEDQPEGAVVPDNAKARYDGLARAAIEAMGDEGVAWIKGRFADPGYAVKKYGDVTPAKYLALLAEIEQFQAPAADEGEDLVGSFERAQGVDDDIPF
jgi:hypothetical protein